MKKQNKIAVMVGACLLSFALSCNKEKPDCGCNGPIINTVSDRTGKLGYDETRKMHVIVETMGNMSSFAYVCSPSNTLINIYKKYPEGTNITVKYGGDLKDLCVKQNSNFEYSEGLIKILSIEDITEVNGL